MFKKLLVASVILATTSGIAFADAAPYVGGSVGVKNDSSAREIVGTIAGGYGATLGAIQNLYLGGEIFADLGSISLTNKGGRTTFGLGASVIPGVKLNQSTLAYARAGVISSRFEDIASNRSGTQFGLGMQTNLVQHLDLRGEYVYTAYRHVSALIGSPKADQINLGLIYKFD